MTADPVRVKLRCPLCGWESREVDVQDEINGVWFALQQAGTTWHPHWDTHKPPPERVLIYADGVDAHETIEP